MKTKSKIMALVLAGILIFSGYSSFFAYALTEAELDIKWLDEFGNKLEPLEYYGEHYDVFSYYNISKFTDGIARVEKKIYFDGMTSDSYGYVSKDGQKIIPTKLFSGQEFSDGLAGVGIYENGENKYFYYDQLLQPVTGLELWAMPFSEGLAAFEKDKKWGYIDKTGKVIIEAQYDRVKPFSEGLAGVKKDGKWGYINKAGNLVITPRFKYEARLFSEGLAAFEKDDKWGYIDKTGKVVIDAQFEHGASFSEGLARVLKDEKWGYIDKTGKFVIEPQLEFCRDFSESLAAFRKDEKWGYIDKTGKVMVEAKFEEVEAFSEGLAAVIIIEDDFYKYGYIDKQGNWFIEPSFSHVTSFSEGHAAVTKITGEVELINSVGDTVIRYETKKGILKNPLINSNKQGTVSVKPNALYSEQALVVDGKAQKGLEVYNIDGSNYFKLRDIAMLSKGKKAEFSVDWNGEKQLISLEKGKSYQPKGSELKAGDKKDKPAEQSQAKLEIDGELKNLSAYNINGQNYFKLRDLGKALDFKVSWDNENKQIVLEMK